MTEKEAIAFEESKMEGGAFAGQPIYKVPVGYIIACATDSDFTVGAKRYVKSNRFLRRLDEE